MLLFHTIGVLMSLKCQVQVLTLQELQIPPSFNIINKCITALILYNFSHYYFCDPLTLGVGIFGYIKVIKLKDFYSEVWYIPWNICIKLI